MTLMKTLGFNDQSYRQMASVQWPINKNHVVCDVMPMVLCVVCVYWVANRNIMFCDVMPMVSCVVKNIVTMVVLKDT